MKEIDAETMELLLNYIYTGRVSDFKAVSVVELFKVFNNQRSKISKMFKIVNKQNVSFELRL